MNPVSRRELIQRLRQLDFKGPFAGGRHPFMKRGRLKLHVPNPHEGNSGVPLLREILRQAGTSESEWEK